MHGFEAFEASDAAAAAIDIMDNMNRSGTVSDVKAMRSAGALCARVNASLVGGTSCAAFECVVSLAVQEDGRLSRRHCGNFEGHVNVDLEKGFITHFKREGV